MLQIVVPEIELFDDSTQTFISCKETKLNLEHSLISLSKWESKWHKPFLSAFGKQSNVDLTDEEVRDYIRCMTINSNVDPNVYFGLTKENYDAIIDYINNPMTATWFNEKSSGGGSKQIVTNEVIYGWMVAYQIPFDCEKWHLTRLLTLIKVCEVNQNPKKKMPRQELVNRNKQLNEERRKKLNTRG